MSGFNFGDSPDTDWFGNPKGGGCLYSFIILVLMSAIIGCCNVKAVKSLSKNISEKPPKTEQLQEVKTNNVKDTIAYYNSTKYR